MKNLTSLLFILVILLACQVIPTPPALQATQQSRETQQIISSLQATTAAQSSNNGSEVTHTPASPSGELPEIPYSSDQPFADIDLIDFDPDHRGLNWSLELPASLELASNYPVAGGLTLRQRRALARDGLLIVRSQEDQFFDVHMQVSYYYGQPYLLTTDAAYHAFKLTYAELLLALEREELSPRLTNIIRSTYEQVTAYLPLTVNTDLEESTTLAAAYLGTALMLLDPEAAIDPEIENQVAEQVEQILVEERVVESKLLPGTWQDFSLYVPTGHYKNDADLTGYFRARTWLENTHFSMDPEGSHSSSYEVPLIISLALRQAGAANTPTLNEFASLMEVFDFIYGNRSGVGAVEVTAFMDQAYGRFATILSMLDDSKQETFLDLLREQPFPLSGAVPVFRSTRDLNQESWSLLGLREGLDQQALNYLHTEGSRSIALPFSPGGLEFMAVLGSQQAKELVTKYGYEISKQASLLSGIEDTIANRYRRAGFFSAEDLWLMSFWSLPGFLTDDSAEFYAPFATEAVWPIKALNSALGAWVDFQSDIPRQDPRVSTSLDLNTFEIPPAPAFVEPIPEVFYRLAQLSNSLAAGLQQRGMIGANKPNSQPSILEQMILEMLNMGDRMGRFGDIAVRELAGEKLTAADYAVIQAPLGPAEISYFQALSSADDDLHPLMAPLPGIRTLDYEGDRLTHMAVGKVDRLFMLVPFEGDLTIAQGGIYSYYEFSVLRSRRLDEESWIWKLGVDPPEKPAWLDELYFTEGMPIDVLAFRIGDLYRVLPEAEILSLRSSPGLDSESIGTAKAGDVFKIIAGPQEAHGMIWWNADFYSDTDIIQHGWIIEKQEWYARVWDH